MKQNNDPLAESSGSCRKIGWSCKISRQSKANKAKSNVSKTVIGFYPQVKRRRDTYSDESIRNR
jgi:hypothetical protein